MMMALPHRFWAKIDPVDGCWVWTGAVDRGGYARFAWRGQNSLAHRLAFEKVHGSVPTGLEIDHLCRNRACVNPAHMEAVTRRENVLRGVAPAAFYAQRTHCEHGHPLSGFNLVIREDGSSRRCRTCRKMRQRRYDARRRGRAVA